MCILEIIMVCLNKFNILCYFFYVGIDDMVDNICYFGLNNMFVDNGFDDVYEICFYFLVDVN